MSLSLYRYYCCCCNPDLTPHRDLFTEQVVKNRLQARYSVYCINKSRSARVMVRRKLSLDKIQVRSGLREDIGSLLIKPVQRLLK